MFICAVSEMEAGGDEEGEAREESKEVREDACIKELTISLMPSRLFIINILCS